MGEHLRRDPEDAGKVPKGSINWTALGMTEPDVVAAEDTGEQTKEGPTTGDQTFPGEDRPNAAVEDEHAPPSRSAAAGVQGLAEPAQESADLGTNSTPQTTQSSNTVAENIATMTDNQSGAKVAAAQVNVNNGNLNVDSGDHYSSTQIPHKRPRVRKSRERREPGPPTPPLDY
jgi:hypothetical protein